MYLAVVYIPLVAAIISGLLYLCSINSKNNISKYVNLFAWFICASGMGIAFIISIIVLQNIMIYKTVQKVALFSWFTVERIYVLWEFSFNTVSAVMLFIITMISLVVYAYSLGYMGIQKKEKLAKFMFYLSSFSCLMMFLVLSNDLLQMFLAWEGISLFSYYLISFLYHNKDAPIAANKSFIVNRVADFCFLIAIFIVFKTFGTFNIDNIFNQLQALQEKTIVIAGVNFNAITVISLLLTIAAMGKSAQLFFQVWLPDAMEAPTPVSALLHAATMVTAGVFLLVRFSPLISNSDFILQMIVLVGGITTFLGASIAVVSTNLKKIIAYSTISQIGYMFIAIGSEFYNGAMFHIFTHAFFKGCLFLCAGIIIHRMDGEQDIYKMGGLCKKMPIVYISTFIAVLALCGIPPFSGFYSKEAILGQVIAHGGLAYNVSYILGTITTFLTSFYCFKLIILVFHGSKRYIHYHNYKSITMTISVILLSFFAIIAGFYYSSFIGKGSDNFWGKEILHLEATESGNVFLNYLPLFLTVIGLFSAYVIYFKRYGISNNIANNFSNIYKFLINKWYFDKLYNKVFVNNFYRLGKAFTSNDEKILNTIGVNFTARIFYRLSAIFNKMQTGHFYDYIWFMLAGLFILLLMIILGL